MRLDHIAYRVKDRYKTAKFFDDSLGYTIGTEFQIEFDDNSKADCIALVPPENRVPDTNLWKLQTHLSFNEIETESEVEYHAPAEIFISDGPLWDLLLVIGLLRAAVWGAFIILLISVIVLNLR